MIATRLPVRVARQDRLDPALLKGPLGDLVLDVLDVHGPVVDGQRAGRFAGSGTDPPGDLGKIVRGVQVVRSRLPMSAIDQVVELGDAVLHRATRAMAERNAAIHAPRSLLVEHLFDQRLVDFIPVLDPLRNRTVGNFAAGELLEACGIAHECLS